MLNRKQAQFVALIIQGTPSGDAYQAAFHPDTANRDSLRAMAARERRKPAVSEAIAKGLEALHADAVQGAIWTQRAAMVARIQDIGAIDAELQRRADGLQMEIDGIQADETLADARKKQLIGRAMQRPILGRDLLTAKQMIYAALDGHAITDGADQPISMAARILQLSVDAITENPDDYCVNRPGTAPSVIDTADAETPMQPTQSERKILPHL